MGEDGDERLSRIEGDVAALKGDVAILRERMARIEGIVETIKQSIWLGFTLLALLVSLLRLV